MAAKGKVVQVIGPVVDCEFPADHLPEIWNAIMIRGRHQDKALICEVAQQLGDSVVRTVAMDQTDGLVRGDEAEDTGGPIAVPVGEPCLGRLMNVLGEPIDAQGAINIAEELRAHCPQGELRGVQIPYRVPQS